MREPKAGDVVLIAHRIRSVDNSVAIMESGSPIETKNLQPIPKTNDCVWVLAGVESTEGERHVRSSH